ncbi:MAG: hypothetical protein BWY49_00007 [Candidatus Omnitrophica bacterium ADurb.Bin314]|nr:MAG: hypothetical protein BWY49_00007 [Candidatus Omnitrophica bacterium ADurb.Bin314]
MLQLDPRAVDGVPHLAGERGAHRARIHPRALDAVADRGRVVEREGEVVDHVLFVRDHKIAARGVPGKHVFQKLFDVFGRPPRRRHHVFQTGAGQAPQDHRDFFGVRGHDVIPACFAAEEDRDPDPGDIPHLRLEGRNVTGTVHGPIAARHNHGPESPFRDRPLVVRGDNRKIVRHQGIRERRLHDNDRLRAGLPRKKLLNRGKTRSRGHDEIRAGVLDRPVTFLRKERREPVQPPLDPRSHQRGQRKKQAPMTRGTVFDMGFHSLELQTGTVVELRERAHHPGDNIGLLEVPGLAVREDQDPPRPAVLPPLVLPEPLAGIFRNKLLERGQVLPRDGLDALFVRGGRIVPEDIPDEDLMPGMFHPDHVARHQKRAGPHGKLEGPRRDRCFYAEERKDDPFRFPRRLVGEHADQFTFLEGPYKTADTRAAADRDRTVRFPELVQELVQPRVFLVARKHMDRCSPEPGDNLQKFPVPEVSRQEHAPLAGFRQRLELFETVNPDVLPDMRRCQFRKAHDLDDVLGHESVVIAHGLPPGARGQTLTERVSEVHVSNAPFPGKIKNAFSERVTDPEAGRERKAREAGDQDAGDPVSDQIEGFFHYRLIPRSRSRRSVRISSPERTRMRAASTSGFRTLEIRSRER